MSNGSGWYKITLVNTAPSISLSSTTARPTATHLTVDITYTVTEPEGTPVTVALANSGIATTGNVAITHTTSNNHVRLVFDGTTKYSGDASVTLSVSDGVNTGTGTITLNTAYYSGENTAETVTLLKATGTAGNDNWDDKSSSNHTITDYGAIEQLAFSPYRDNGYSMYFDGTTNTYTSVSSVGSLFGSDDFTVECWVYFDDAPNDDPIWEMRSTQGNTDGLVLLAYDNGFFCYHQTITHRIDGRGKSYITNKWSHVVVQRSSGTLTMYVDGISIGTATWNYNLSTNSSDFIISGGRYTSGSSNISTFTKAFISDFRIVKGATVYSADFDPPTERLTTITNTELLIGGNGFRDNKPLTTASQKSLYFGTNSNNYLLNYGDQAALEFGTNSWTIEAWIYSTGTMSNAGIFSRGANGSFWHSLHMTSASTIKYVLSNGAGKEWNYTSSGSQIPTNTWVHVALVRRFGTDIKLYVNGTAIKTDTSSASTTLGDSTGDFKIGFERFQGSGGGFNGYISNFRFVNGTAVYTGNFTPPTSPLTNITNTVILHHGLTNEVTGGVGNPSNTSVTVNSLSPFNTIYTITPNGNSFLAAYSPYDRENAYTTTTGGGSARLRPQGGNDYFTAPASSDFAMGTGDFTLEVWVYPENLSVHQMILDTITPGVSGSQAGRFVAYLNPNKLAYYRPGTGTTTSSGSQTVKLFSWNHLAWVRNSGTIKMYLNGEETHSVSETYNFSLTNLTLGRDAASGGAGQARSYWSDLRLVKGTAVYTSEFIPPTAPLGTISGTVLHLPFTDFRIFDKSQSYLPPQSVSVDRLGITNAVASSTQQHFSENTIYFDGTGDYIDIPNPIIGTEDHTHEAWVYPTAGSTNYKGFFASAPDGSGSGINVSKDVAGGGNNSGPMAISFNPVVPDNEWSHVVLQRQSGVHSLYRNGVLQGTSTSSINITSTNLRLASRYTNTTTYGFGGYMHDFRVSKGLARYPYVAKPVTLTTTNSGMTKPDGTTPTVTASNVTLLTCHAGTAGSATITDGSSNNTTIITNGNAVVSDFGPAPGMKSVYFDGTGDYLQCTLADTLGTADWTIEYWVYHNNTDDNDIHCAFGGYAPAFYYRNGSSAFAVYHNPGISGNHNANITPIPRRWYHMAYVHDDSANTLTVFANGTQVDSFTYTGNISSTTFRIGDDGTSAWMDGYISNLRIVKSTALYSANFTPSTSAFQ